MITVARMWRNLRRSSALSVVQRAWRAGLSIICAGRSPPVRSTIRIVALTSCAVLSGVGAASAQTPMQFWHQEWSRQRDASVQQDQGGSYPYYQQRSNQQRGWCGGGNNFDGFDPEPDPSRERATRGPMVHVDNPTFFEYKPDAVKASSVSTICKPQPAPAAQVTLQPRKVSETTGAAPVETPAVAADPAPSPFADACAADTQRLRALPELGKALTAWYGAHPQFVWSDGSAVSAKAIAAMATLNASDKVGLVPDD